MNGLAEYYQNKIKEALPEGKVMPAHNEKGHFYVINDPEFGNPTYPSVTAKLQLLKDEGLMNYKMNRAIDYVFANYKSFTDENILEQLGLAAQAPVQEFEDAGDIGRQIHDCREVYFKEWIKIGEKPQKESIYSISDPLMAADTRIISTLRALDSFIKDYRYWPIACELYVYSHKLKCAGTLDDIGLMYWIKRQGQQNCPHTESIIDEKKNKITCMVCGHQTSANPSFVLMDVKTSNRFKDHYFFQVGLYYSMFYKLTGLRPEKVFILKLDKENGTYKLENLRQPSRLATYGRALIRTNEGMDFIKSLRKDNLKRVGEKLEL